MRRVLFISTYISICGLVLSACDTTTGQSVQNSYQREANQTCIAPLATQIPNAISSEAAFPNLDSLPTPVAMVQPNNDGNFWLALNRFGTVIRFDNTPTVADTTTVLDISAKLATDLELGLTGIAIHPNYPTDNRMFLLYNDDDNNRRSTLSSFTINTSTQMIDAASETVLLTLDQPANNHNGGDLAFDSNHLLYAAFGDGGFDMTTSQDNTNIHGTIIRIDVSGASYTVPSENPFNTGQPLCTSSAASTGQTCPEIYANGFRNPWRFSIDQATDEIWLGDVGEDDFEEINRVNIGRNYGWPIMEGPSCFDDPSESCEADLYEAPITSYGRDGGVSVSGGYVYRGDDYPQLQGTYLFGDVFSNRVWSINSASSENTEPSEEFNSGSQIAGWAQGNDGEVYYLDMSGGEGENVFKITSGSVDGFVMPNQLSETGCFNVDTKDSPSGVFDYAINSPLWSDGAEKLRAFALPDDAAIRVLDDGDFDFPQNAILIKHFLNGDTFLETRLLVNHASGWAGYSYEWNDSQTDATLLTSSKSKDVGNFVHDYPSQAQCSTCHQAAANHSLGIELAQLNRLAQATSENQIDQLSGAGYLDLATTGEESNRLNNPLGNEGSLQARALSYLHSNCSGCHREGGPAAFMDLRFNQPLADSGFCGVSASNDMGVIGAERVMPGNPDASTLVLRMEATDEQRMPPLGTRIVDSEAIDVIRSWILNLETCE